MNKDLFKSLAFKLSIIILLIEIVSLSILGLYYVNYFSDEVERKLAKQSAIPGVLMNDGLLNYEAVSDKKAITSIVGEEIISGMIMGTNKSIFYAMDPLIIGKSIDELHLKEDVFEISQSESKYVKGHDTQGDYMVSVTPLYSYDEKTPLFLYLKIKTTLKEHKTEQKIIFLVGSLLCILLTTIGIVFFFRKIVIQRLNKLEIVSQNISDGNLDIKTHMKSHDEIGKLASSFDNMISILKESHQKLKDHSTHLEQKVTLQTDELSRKMYELEKAKKILFEKQKEIEKANADIEEFNVSLERQVAVRTKELEKAYTEISDLLRLKSQFINQVAHDLKTPLTPINILFPLALKDLEKGNYKDAKEKLEVIEKNFSYLLSLVLETLSIARMDSGKVKLNIEAVNIYELMEKATKNNELDLEKSKVKIINNVQKNIPLIKIDTMRIQEVLNNIISNAIKYIGERENKTITLDATTNKETITIAVADNGVGVKKEFLEKIFEEFFKVNQSRHDAAASSGLGLTICKRIIALHKGKIWAESEGLGKGLTIKFTLPLN
jgi:signal transduction histidine kinase